MGVHIDALTLPEFIEILLTQPLRRSFGMVSVCGGSLNTLVVLDMSLQLIVTNHGVAEETELVTRLLRLVVNHLIGKVSLDRMFLIF